MSRAVFLRLPTGYRLRFYYELMSIFHNTAQTNQAPRQLGAFIFPYGIFMIPKPSYNMLTDEELARQQDKRTNKICLVYNCTRPSEEGIQLCRECRQITNDILDRIINASHET
jgi:hypothetical protein